MMATLEKVDLTSDRCFGKHGVFINTQHARTPERQNVTQILHIFFFFFAFRRVRPAICDFLHFFMEDYARDFSFDAKGLVEVPNRT